MTERSGLGAVEVGILEALEAMRATPLRSHVKTARVLAEAEARTGLGRRYLYKVLLDLARPWKVPVQLVQVHGDYGSPSYPASDPSYNESRLSPAGVVVLAAEHGELGPVPIGMINGSFYSGGLRPPFDPDRLLMALRRLVQRPSVTNRELAAIVGAPDFGSGCAVDGDLAAMVAGKSATLRLHPQVTVADGDVVIEALPPGVTASQAISRLKHPEETMFFSEATGFERRLGVRLPLGTIEDRSFADNLRIVCEVIGDVDSGDIAESIRETGGVAVDVTVRLPSPLARLLRAWVTDHKDENLTESIDALQQALDAARRDAEESRRQDEERRREGEESARRRRIPRERLFPTQLATKTLDLDTVAESARVALTYGGGDLIGTVGLSPVEVRYSDSNTRGARTGSISDVGFEVSWRQSSTRTGTAKGLTLTGTTADAPVRLQAALRPGPRGSFGYATVTGSIAEQAVEVEVHAADGGLRSGDAVKIEGTFAGSTVDLYADVLANRHRLAVLRGTCDGAVVHVDISRRAHSDPREVTGTYEGPTALLVIILAALLSF